MQFFLYITTIILVNHVLLYKEHIKSVTSYIHIYNLHKPWIHKYSFHGPGSPRDKGLIFLDKIILKIEQMELLWLFFSPFLFSPKKRGKRKGEWSSKNRDQKPCLSARSILKIGNFVSVHIKLWIQKHKSNSTIFLNNFFNGHLTLVSEVSQLYTQG